MKQSSTEGSELCHACNAWNRCSENMHEAVVGSDCTKDERMQRRIKPQAPFPQYGNFLYSKPTAYLHLQADLFRTQKAYGWKWYHGIFDFISSCFYSPCRGCPFPPIVIVFVVTYSSMPSILPSRPKPDSLTPPKGAAGSEINPVFTPTMPTSSASATL